MVHVLQLTVHRVDFSLELVWDVGIVDGRFLDRYFTEHGLRSAALQINRKRRQSLFAAVLETLHRSGHQTARIKPLIVVLQISLLLDSPQVLSHWPNCFGSGWLEDVLDEVS